MLTLSPSVSQDLRSLVCSGRRIGGSVEQYPEPPFNGRGPIFIKLKGEEQYGETISLESEKAFYFLKNVPNALVTGLPPLLYTDEKAELFVFSGLANCISLFDELKQNPLTAQSAVAVGKQLAALHNWKPVGLVNMPKIESPITTYGHITIDTLARSRGRFDLLLKYVHLSPELNLSFQNLKWKKANLIHGDLKLDNVLYDHTLSTTYLTDWELCGIGDVDWDCGAFIGSTYHAHLYNANSKDTDDISMSEIQSWIKHFLNEYSHSAKRAVELDRIFTYAALWLVNRAEIELAQKNYASMNPNFENAFAIQPSSSSLESRVIELAQFDRSGIRLPFEPTVECCEAGLYSPWFSKNKVDELAVFIYRSLHLRLTTAVHQREIESLGLVPFFPVDQIALENLTHRFKKKTYRDSGWKIKCPCQTNRGLHIEKNGVNLFLPNSSHSYKERGEASVDIDVPCFAPFRQIGFFVAYSHLGAVQDENIVRVYLNLAEHRDGNVLFELWSACRTLNIPFTLKCVADQSFYTRSDCVVGYFPYEVRFKIADFISESLHSGEYAFNDKTSLFIENHSPGIGIAIEHIDANSQNLKSHGQKQSEQLAKYLLDRIPE